MTLVLFRSRGNLRSVSYPGNNEPAWMPVHFTVTCMGGNLISVLGGQETETFLEQFLREAQKNLW